MIFVFGKCSFNDKIINQIWCSYNSFEYKSNQNGLFYFFENHRFGNFNNTGLQILIFGGGSNGHHDGGGYGGRVVWTINQRIVRNYHVNWNWCVVEMKEKKAKRRKEINIVSKTTQ
jgi:hypothetical protein